MAMPEPSPSPLIRILWFVGLWAAGVLTVGIGAELLKLIIFRQW
ncbi:DUF2474 domain-containing protein [Kozakia baliensis]|nr:DUF2474 domain-containing protein [Kozakia baliensis]